MIKTITKGTLSFFNNIKVAKALVVGFRTGDSFLVSNLELHEDMKITLDPQKHILTLIINNFKDSDYLVMYDQPGMKDKVEI